MNQFDVMDAQVTCGSNTYVIDLLRCDAMQHYGGIIVLKKATFSLI